MFDQLVSSRIERRVAPMRGLVVGMLHGIVIAGAIRVTAQPGGVAVSPIEHVIIFDPPLRSPPPAAPSDPAAPAVSSSAPLLPIAPIEVPTSLPPVIPGPAIDPEVLRRILVPGAPGRLPGGGDSASVPGVLAAAEVDDPAVILHQPSPRYPPVLQHAGIEGRVVVEFVIDTTGHLETASLRVVESSNPGFNDAAGETVRRAGFRPARVRGRPVRQRATQAIAFRITPE